MLTGPMTPRARARQRRRRILLGMLTFLVLVTMAAFFGLPPIIKSQALTRLASELHRPVSIGRVRLNPFALSLTIENFEIRDRDGRAPFVAWDRLYVNFEARSFFTGKWEFAAIELSGPRARVLVNRDGSLNFSDLLTAVTPDKKAQTPAAAAKPLRIDRLTITGARLDFRDESRAQPFATTLGPVGFDVKDFYTVGGEQAPYSFEAVTESGEKFSWHGWIESAPFRSGGELGVSGLLLKKYAPYYAEKLGVDLADGRLTVKGRYEVSFDEKRRVLKLLEGSVALRNLKLVERSTGETLFELPAADLTGATADGLALKAAAKQAILQGGKLNLRRAKDGTLNLAKLIAPATAPSAPTPLAPVSLSSAPATPAFALKVGEMGVRDWAVDVQDDAAPRPAKLGISGFSAVVKNFTLEPGAKIPAEVVLAWQPRGTLRALGTVSLVPLSADLQLQLDGMSLLPLSPYAEQGHDVRLADGALSLKGHATLALSEGAAPAVGYDGDVWVEKLDLVTGAPSESFAGFSDLILNGIKISTASRLSISLTEVNLNAPYARAVMSRDGKLNVAEAFAKAAEARPSTPPLAPLQSPLAKTAPAGPQIDVARVVINGGEFDFTDRSVSPQVRVAVNQFGGTLTGLSSSHPGRGDLDLKASINGVGPVSIAGTLDPLAGDFFVDAKVDAKSVDLLPLSPYVGKYAGYELARGKLALAITAKVAQRRVEMGNVVTLDQFTFGRATNSSDATKLPVRLGVALLKDMDGKIVLDVPVQGSLDDPEFKIGRVVWRVIGNLLTKAAVSPFSLLGSMFGGGGEELGWQEFAPGESELSPENVKKLSTLVTALNARPALTLAIDGNYDEAADTYVLKRQKLERRIRQTIWDDRHAQNPDQPPLDQITFTAEERAAMVKKMFDRRFPPGTEFGTPLPPPPLVPPPPAHENETLVRKVWNFVTLKKPREQAAYEVAQKKAMNDYTKQIHEAAAAGLPQDEMSGRLAEVMEINPDDLRALADARAQRVRDYLVNEGKVSPDRLFLAKSATDADATAPAAASKGPRVLLQLQ